MFDETMGWHFGVDRADTAGSYIIVSRRQVAAVCWLLATHQVPHTVEGFVPDVQRRRPDRLGRAPQSAR